MAPKDNTQALVDRAGATERQRRLANERAFHNQRFSHEIRADQGKYYAAIKYGTRDFEARVLACAQNRDVLEYGCGSAIQGIQIANVAKSLTGIDISDVAVADASNAATTLGLTNARYLRMDAEDLEFEDASFDLVFGRGIIHHLDLERSFASISRVLRAGGRAIFWEPLGHNPILNQYRKITPEARTPDEHPLTKADFELTKKYFELASTRFYGLTTILTVPVRDTAVGDGLLRLTTGLDWLIFKSPLRWLAWHCLIELRKP
jgi:ubiquinone/menaquinone biosynthesis C-methylase UbiE